MPTSARLAVFLLLFTLLLTPTSYAYQQIECIRELGQAGQKAKQRTLNAPRALALFEDRIYIADTDAHRVLVLDRDGKTVMTWGKKGDDPGEFRSPASISLDEQGRVYVADTGNHRIQVFDAKGVFIRVIGGKGSGPREFKGPAGIAAQRGFLTIADTGNSRVQILTYDGIFMRQIAPKADGDEMKTPVAVAVDVQNRIYVLDSEAYRIRVFGHDGRPLFQFGLKGKGTEGLSDPQGLAVDAWGNIFVSDTGNYKLKKFDAKGKMIASLGSKGDGPGQFREAAGMAVDADGKVYVLDAGKHTLQTFACELGDAKPLSPLSPPAGIAFLKELSAEVNALAVGRGVYALSGDSIIEPGVLYGRKIGARGSKPGLLKKPGGLAVDKAGNLWVADTGNDRVQKFSAAGAPLQVFGKSGSGEGAFDAPSALAIGSNGNIYVVDTGNKRVQVLHPKGMFLGAIGKPGKNPGQFAEPVDIALSGAEYVYVVDRGNNRISKFDSNGAFIWERGGFGQGDGEFDRPSNILLSPDGEIYVLDAGNARIQVFDTSGKFLRKFGSEGTRRGEFQSPEGLALEGGLHLYVGDRGNKRVQVFQLRQTPLVPQRVTAKAGANEVNLYWTGNVESYLEQYRIYRSDPDIGAFKLAGTSPGPFFADRGLPSNRNITYRVTSVAREGNESAASEEISAETPKLIPATPKKVKIEAFEKQIMLSWLPNLEPYISHYNVYRSRQPSAGFEPAVRADRPVFSDRQLADETVYYYQITAVGREGDESPASEVVFTTTPKASLTLPPLEFASVDIGDFFASAYKYYELHAVGKVVIKNNTDNDFPKVKLTFAIKDYMDFPTELDIELVPAGKQVELELKPVFNNKILEVTENTPLQSELGLTYYVGGEPRKLVRSFPVLLYERHAMVWDKKEKLGAFVTPKDPPVADFTRAVMRPYVDAYPNLHPSIVYARAVYDALGVAGLKYIVDPTSPFQELSGKSAAVDYLQYPRDTLNRKSGDCDDLSILFTACMEDIGVGTAFVDVPGHVFIMINTGVVEKDKATLGFPDDLLVVREGAVWLPVEMTMVGSSFTRAWQKGAEEYRDWSAKGKANVVETQKAWGLFKPATLPHTDFQAARPGREAIEAKFPNELEALAGQRLANLSAEYLAVLKKKPNDVVALGQLGILYGENGMHVEALEQFQKILAADNKNALALNNSGNIYFLQDRLENAKAAYEAALKSEPGDTGTMANLARVLLGMGKKQDAKKLFQDAAAKDPRVVRRYGDLASDLGIVK